MKATFKFIMVILTMLLLAPDRCEARDKEWITAMVPQDVLVDYVRFLNGRNPLEITSFHGEMSRRDVVELVLLQQALHLGGIDLPVEFVVGPSYCRILEEVRMGRIDLTATTAWLSDLRDLGENVAASKALVQTGHFEAGLYTSKDNHKALAVDSVEKLRELLVVSSQDWAPDWKALKGMGLPRLQHLPQWSLMVKMVFNQRADCVLAPFQCTPDLSLYSQWGTLVPIPGVKVGLSGSRHFFVFTATAHGQRIHTALNKGVDLMLTQGIVDKAYQDCGFYNVATEHWKRLN